MHVPPSVPGKNASLLVASNPQSAANAPSHLRLRIFLEMGAGRIRKKPGQGMIFDHCASAASADASRGSNSAIRARNSSSVGCHFRSTSCSRAATFSFRAPMVKFSSCNAAICARLGERRSSCLVHLSCNTPARQSLGADRHSGEPPSLQLVFIAVVMAEDFLQAGFDLHRILVDPAQEERTLMSCEG